MSQQEYAEIRIRYVKTELRRIKDQSSKLCTEIDINFISQFEEQNGHCLQLI